MIFVDRRDAGKKLAKEIAKIISKDEKVVVLGLPRGGVAVGFEVAKILKAPLDVCICRKLGAPGQEELAIGAVAEGGERVLDDQLINSLGISQQEIERITAREQKEIKKRVVLYREGKPLPDLAGKTVVLADDGVATGLTAEAAVKSIKKLSPKEIIFAVPVGAVDSIKKLKALVNDLVCLSAPPEFSAVGEWYRDFSQVTDGEVMEMLTGSNGQPKWKVG